MGGEIACIVMYASFLGITIYFGKWLYSNRCVDSDTYHDWEYGNKFSAFFLFLLTSIVMTIGVLVSWFSMNFIEYTGTVIGIERKSAPHIFWPQDLNIKLKNDQTLIELNAISSFENYKEIIQNYQQGKSIIIAIRSDRDFGSTTGKNIITEVRPVKAITNIKGEGEWTMYNFFVTIALIILVVWIMRRPMRYLAKIYVVWRQTSDKNKEVFRQEVERAKFAAEASIKAEEEFDKSNRSV